MNTRFHPFLLALVLTPLCWLPGADAADNRGRTDAPAGGNKGQGGSIALGESEDCGCTYTQGYWKNHSAYSSNPNQQIPWPLSEDSVLCGETWYDIINTPPAGGDTWLILAHQWIAAMLNVANGANDDALGTALADAEDLLVDNCDGIGEEDEEDALDLARTLDDYNNGLIGPGHCDETGSGECEPPIIPFCEGDGSENGGEDCPCGNEVPSGTTAGCLNRDGVGASLTASGNPSVSNDTLVLLVTGLPNGVPGFFFQGEADAGYTPFGNGLRCLGGPFIRLAKIAGQPGGNSYPPPGELPISEEFNLQPGDVRYYQVLYRDSGGPCGGSTNTSNGLCVTWQP